MNIIKKYYKLIEEQEMNDEDEKNKNLDQPEEDLNNDSQIPQQDQNIGVDQMNMQDPNSMDNNEQPMDSAFIGKKFELNKIYQRLITLQSFLSDISDEKLLVLRQYVSNSIELFELMINNITAYRGELDDIIVLYYKFLTIMYGLIKDYHEKTEQKD